MEILSQINMNYINSGSCFKFQSVISLCVLWLAANHWNTCQCVNVNVFISLDDSSEEYTAEDGDLNRHDIVEDAALSVNKIMEKYHYNVEVHHVTTEDGYILTMHRLRHPDHVQKTGRPFLLQHGLMDSSAGFVIMGPNISLSYYLANYGYDCWLGNARGNTYSRNHTSKSVEDDSFWDFSWHEIGMYDLPAMIDYVLNKTGHKQLEFVGHSQGCTAFFVMCSMRPEYNKKVSLMHAMAPAVYFKETKHHPLLATIKLLIDGFEVGNFQELMNWNLELLCISSQKAKNFCMYLMSLLAGNNREGFNPQMFPLIVNHYPSPVSLKQVKHYLQLVESGRFQQFDYDVSKNKKLYKSEKPPEYDLKNVMVPTYVYYGENDQLCHRKDIEALTNDLGNNIDRYLVPKKEFNHLDFVIGRNARWLVFDHLLTITKKFENNKFLSAKFRNSNHETHDKNNNNSNNNNNNNNSNNNNKS